MSNKIKTRLNNKDFEHFKKRFIYWQKELNQKNFYIEFRFLDIENIKARVFVNPCDGCVLCELSNNWYGDEVTNKEIDKTAFHEVCEVMLHKLGFYATRMISEHCVEEEIHKVINILENYLFTEEK